MPRTYGTTINPNSPITKTRKKEHDYINAETNTDPWQPPCQKCLQRQNSQFVFENNTIDMNEYVKAINYINSIHSLINETLLSKPGQGLRRSSDINLKANIAMPDLPNFLTLLSGINNFNNNNNLNTNCSHMVSQTTSTSALITTVTTVNNPDESTQEDETSWIIKCNEHHKEGHCEQIDNEEDLVFTSLEELNDDQGPQSAEEEEVHSELYQELHETSFDEHSKTDPFYITEDQECNCRHCSKANLKHTIDIDTSITTIKKEEMSLLREKHLKEYYKHVTESNKDLQRKRSTPEISMIYEVIKQIKDNPNCDRITCTDKNTGNAYHKLHNRPVLSDADLDRYASELLTGIESESCNTSAKPGETLFTFTVPVVKHISPAEKPKVTKSRLPQAQLSPERKKLTPKLKAPPQVKQKSFTQIPVKPNFRPTSATSKRSSCRSCSPVKNRTSNSTSAKRPGSANVSNPRHLKTDSVINVHVNEGCKLVHNEKQDSVKTFKSMSSAKPKISNIQLPSLTSVEKSKFNPKHHNVQANSQSNPASLSFQSQKKPLQRHERNTKKVLPYKVQQKEDDDFVCPRKSFKTQLEKSSKTVILSDKKDGGVMACTDIDVCDGSHKVNAKRTKAFTFQSKPSRNDLMNVLQEMQRSNERFVLSIPAKKKRDPCKQTFRQARRQSGDSEEIVHFRNYVNPSKHLNDSDSNSNDTNFSDIKTDKSPHYSKIQ